jgi:hypothetical protein
MERQLSHFRAWCLLVGVLLVACAPRFEAAIMASQKKLPAPDLKPANTALEAAKEVYEGYIAARDFGNVQDRHDDDSEFLHRWSKRWLDAEIEIGKEKNKQIAAYSAHMDRMKALEKLQKGRYRSGDISRGEFAETEYFRIEAEQWLAEAKSR